VRLAVQDRSRWNRDLIEEGHAMVRACLRRTQPGPFQIQAAIAAVHADAPTAEATDWSQIVALYDQLHALRPNAVVVVNRAAATAELRGPHEGLAALDTVDPDVIDTYQPYHAARADLLTRAGRTAEAIAAYDRAIELTANPGEHRFLAEQRAAAAAAHAEVTPPRHRAGHVARRTDCGDGLSTDPERPTGRSPKPNA
jgi:RNA polymerase sigma-70 factor (ECF subfamily)